MQLAEPGAGAPRSPLSLSAPRTGLHQPPRGAQAGRRGGFRGCWLPLPLPPTLGSSLPCGCHTTTFATAEPQVPVAVLPLHEVLGGGPSLPEKPPCKEAKGTGGEGDAQPSAACQGRWQGEGGVGHAPGPRQRTSGCIAVPAGAVPKTGDASVGEVERLPPARLVWEVVCSSQRGTGGSLQEVEGSDMGLPPRKGWGRMAFERVLHRLARGEEGRNYTE